MTKKNYILVAKALNEVYRSFDGLPEPEMYFKQYAVIQVVGELRNGFQADNPLFDFGKFKKAVYK
jgi:hypothetical protein